MENNCILNSLHNNLARIPYTSKLEMMVHKAERIDSPNGQNNNKIK
jgi:hypothetical protein